MNKYLESNELTVDEVKKGIRIRTINNEIVPMLCGSAFKNKGVQAMLDAVIDYLPSPVDIPPVKGETETGQPVTRSANDDEPFAGLAFKIATDPYVGQLTFVRCYSGVLKSGDTVYNPVRGKKDRIGRLLQMHANERKDIKEVRAGDIAACVGLKDVTTGETLCDVGEGHPAGAHGVPGAGDFAGGRAEDQGRPGKDGRGAWPSGAGRPVVPRAPTRSRARPSFPAWASCTSRSSSTA